MNRLKGNLPALAGIVGLMVTSAAHALTAVTFQADMSVHQIPFAV